MSDTVTETSADYHYDGECGASSLPQLSRCTDRAACCEPLKSKSTHLAWGVAAPHGYLCEYIGGGYLRPATAAESEAYAVAKTSGRARYSIWAEGRQCYVAPAGAHDYTGQAAP